ncbi:MAG: hypothetical protein KGL46_14200, partial [Hyphomicrobiales bacterium]|nr:hypothetical protein [Hyphomicrobiales bacterium]
MTHRRHVQIVCATCRLTHWEPIGAFRPYADLPLATLAARMRCKQCRRRPEPIEAFSMTDV